MTAITAPSVSVVIRARDEASTIAPVLDAVIAQDLAPSEVILLDSGSTDATLEIAGRYPITIRQMDPARFTFGAALNLGVGLAAGELLVSLNADAIPVGSGWLRALVGPLAEPSVAGSYGRQLAMDDSWPIVRYTMESLYDGTRRRFTARPRFSNVNSCVRRQVWQQLPFHDLWTGCEDADWARRLVTRGYRLEYVPAAAVKHSHNETLRKLWFRSWTEGAAAAIREPDSPCRLAGQFKTIAVGIARDWLRLLQERRNPRWLPHSVAYRACRELAFYRGWRDVAAGRLVPGPTPPPRSTRKDY